MRQYHQQGGIGIAPFARTSFVRGAPAVLFFIGFHVAPCYAESLTLLDAIRLNLRNNADIQLQEKQVDSSAAVLQQASGQFDTVISLKGGRNVDNSPVSQYDATQYATVAPNLTQIKSNTNTYLTEADVPLRNGMVVSSNIGVTTNYGTVTDLQRQAPQNAGTVNFSIRVPLAKGRGDIAASGEVAAGHELEAAQKTLRFTISQGVLNTLSSYWTVQANEKNLQIARASEAGIRQMLEENRKLVAADEMAAADIHLLRANLLEKTANRIAAEQSLLEAKQRLGMLLGMGQSQLASMAVEPEFIAALNDASRLKSELARLIDTAMQARPDLLAARLHQKSAKIMTEQTRDALKPQIDLVLNAGYAGLSEGGSAYDGLTRNRAKPNIGATISYQWPVKNNVAQGRYKQQIASYESATIQIGELERSISFSVEAALANVVSLSRQLQESQEVADLYQVVAKNELLKYRLGSSTMLNVLSANDHLLSARQNRISSLFNLLNAQAQLKHQTMSLFAGDGQGQLINIERLLSIP
ncbi:MAG: TolC family protein [Pseudomonadota bacterium]